MSKGNPTPKKLEEIRKRKATLEDERRTIMEPYQRFIRHSDDPTKTDWYAGYSVRLAAVESKLSAVREEENNTLLAILSDQSSQTNTNLEALKRANEELTASSERLNAVTAALLVLTAVLAVAGAGSYSLMLFQQAGFTGQIAIVFTTFVVTIVVIAIVLTFELLTRGHKRRIREIEQTVSHMKEA